MAKKDFYVNIDLNENQLLNVIVENHWGNPVDLTIQGRIIFDSDIKHLKYWDGTVWVPMFIYKLQDLADVAIAAPADQDMLKYDISSHEWKATHITFVEKIDDLSDAIAGTMSLYLGEHAGVNDTKINSTQCVGVGIHALNNNIN